VFGLLSFSQGEIMEDNLPVMQGAVCPIPISQHQQVVIVMVPEEY
jgi:hypothetical protein